MLGKRLDTMLESLLAQASTHLLRRRYAEALNVLSELDRGYPGHFEVQWLSAETLRRTGRLDEAENINERLCVAAPDEKRVWYQRCKLILQRRGLSGLIETAAQFIEERRQLATNFFARNIEHYDPGFGDCSDNYKCGRIYLLAGQIEKARQLFLTAPEKQYAAFDLSVIDYLTDGKPIEIRHYVKDVHSRHLLTIWANALQSRGRTHEVFSFLDTIDAAGKVKPTDIPWTTIKPFFFCTMQKSGTGFLGGAFRHITGVPNIAVTQAVGTDEFIISRWLDDALAAGVIPRGHCSMSTHNSEEILRRRLLVFLSVREPRDATRSWFRFMEERPRLEKMALAYLPPDYCDLSYEERVRVMFERYFPYLVRWLREWKAFLEAHPDHPVLLWRYTDFAKDNHQAVRSLLSFCGGSAFGHRVEKVVNIMKNDAKNLGSYHFKKGQAGSWREMMNDNIRTVIDAHWDADVLHYFDYQK